MALTNDEEHTLARLLGLDEFHVLVSPSTRITLYSGWRRCGDQHHRIEFELEDSALEDSANPQHLVLSMAAELTNRIDCVCKVVGKPGRHPLTWAQADQWWPDASPHFDHDVAPEGWEALLSVELLPRPSAQVIGQRLRAGVMETPATQQVIADGPQQVILWADDMECVDRVRRLGQGACLCVKWTGARWVKRVDALFPYLPGGVAG